MDVTQRPAFMSPDLQVAIDKARDVLEGADEALNRVSRDIKVLEGYLAGLRLPAQFRHSLGKSLVPDNEDLVAASLRYDGSASGKIREEALVLGQDTKGRIRLLYEVSECDGYVDVDMPGGPYFWDEDTRQSEIRPLIEMNFEVRKQVYSHLPAFVTALAKHYVIDPKKLTDWDDDIPF